MYSHSDAAVFISLINRHHNGLSVQELTDTIKRVVQRDPTLKHVRIPKGNSLRSFVTREVRERKLISAMAPERIHLGRQEKQLILAVSSLCREKWEKEGISTIQGVRQVFAEYQWGHGSSRLPGDFTLRSILKENMPAISEWVQRYAEKLVADMEASNATSVTKSPKKMSA